MFFNSGEMTTNRSDSTWPYPAERQRIFDSDRYGRYKERQRSCRITTGRLQRERFVMYGHWIRYQDSQMLLFDFNIRPKPIFVRRLSVDHNLVEVCKIWETKLTFTSYPRFDVSNNLLFLCRYHSKHDWFLKSITGYCTRDSFQRSILNTTHVYYIHKCTFLLWFHAIYIYILDSERSEECICFKMMCFFYFFMPVSINSTKRNDPIFTVIVCFRKQIAFI